MARVHLDISDPITRTTLKAMLEAVGHTIVPSAAAVTLSDDLVNAIASAAATPTIAAVRAADIPQAVAAMRKGVYGYILLPLQPGEADIAIRQALRAPVHQENGDETVLPLEQVEAEHIRAVLRRCKGNHTEAARLLGIGRNTLWRKLKKLTGS